MRKERKINTLKCNKMISKFMGIDFKSKESKDMYAISIWQQFGHYHSNYKWLMEVWNKIESMPEICTGIMYRPKEGHMVSIHTKIKDQGVMFISEGYSKTDKFQAIYKTVVGFIEWYNKQIDIF